MERMKNKLIKILKTFQFEQISLQFDTLYTFKQKLYIKLNESIYETDLYALILFTDNSEWLCKLTLNYRGFELSKEFPIYNQDTLQIDLFRYWYNEFIYIIKIIWGSLL